MITSINVRVSLLKTELENRGQPWVEGEDRKDGNGNGDAETQGTSESTTGNNAQTNGSGSRPAEHADQGENAGQDDGVYL